MNIAIIALVALIDIAWIGFTGFEFVLSSLKAPLISIAVCSIIAIVARQYGLHLVHSLALPLALIFAIWPTKLIFSYLMISANLPLQDTLLASIDTWLGFDWFWYLKFSNEHPAWSAVMHYAYLNYFILSFLTLFFLVLIESKQNVTKYTLAISLSLLATVILGTLIPAGGAYYHFAPDAALYAGITPRTAYTYMDDLDKLRDGTFTLIHLDKLKGLITFPSFHTILPVLTVIALYNANKIAAALAFPFALMVVLSCPIEGGHYFIDIVAGFAIAALSWAATTALLKREAWKLSFGSDDRIEAPGTITVSSSQ